MVGFLEDLKVRSGKLKKIVKVLYTNSLKIFYSLIITSGPALEPK